VTERSRQLQIATSVRQGQRERTPYFRGLCRKTMTEWIPRRPCSLPTSTVPSIFCVHQRGVTPSWQYEDDSKTLKRDGIRLKHHRASGFCLRMISAQTHSRLSREKTQHLSKSGLSCAGRSARLRNRVQHTQFGQQRPPSGPRWNPGGHARSNPRFGQHFCPSGPKCHPTGHARLVAKG
jgi:hypothetical protein